MAAWLKAALPAGWSVVVPDVDAVAPSGYPLESNEESQQALKAFLGSGAPADADFNDMYVVADTAPRQCSLFLSFSLSLSPPRPGLFVALYY